MKTVILSFILAVSFYSSKGQNTSSQQEGMKKAYKSDNYATDSVRSGDELYEGGKGQKNKSQRDTLKGRKKRVLAKPNGSSKQTGPNKNKQANTGSGKYKRITLVMNDFKV